ncbi:MAG: FkbM family methyltransferase [Candidatus Hodarchaeota archaeon]
MKYEKFKFILPKNNLKSIPLHQKYLYAALISYFDIPKYYLLFWDDLIVFHEIFIEKLYDKEFYVSEGDTVLDIGASIGWYTCKISKLVGEKGNIISIEPDIINFNYLKRNIEINNINNVKMLNLGVWSSKGRKNFVLEKYTSSFNNNQKIEKKKAPSTIEVDTIDNILMSLKLKKVNLIKMDVEGAEVEVIKGANDTITNSKDLKLIISAYHKDSFGIESFEYLIPYLEKRNFRYLKKYLPIIFAIKN